MSAIPRENGKALCTDCGRLFTPAWSPRGCAFCWVMGMSKRVLGETRAAGPRAIEPEPVPVVTTVDGFEQWVDDGERAF